MDSALRREYDSVLSAVGFLDLSSRGKVEVRGPDRITFLHSMFSNDVEKLENHAGRYATFLTSTGKIVADLFYYKFPDAVLIDVDSQLIIKMVETLEKFIIMDEVYLSNLSTQLNHFSLQGPRSSALVHRVFGEEGPLNQYCARELVWRSVKVWLIRKDELSEMGFEIIVPKDGGSLLHQAILQEGINFDLCEVGETARDILRLEAGIPRYGVDMDETRYPMEARLDSAISLTKGCYIGQEVVAKATHIGGVGNLLMGLKLRGSSTPSPGARVLEEQGKPIGRITSAVFSPRLQCPIAFAYLKRKLAVPGALYQVEWSSQECVLAEVVERFV